MNYVDLTAAKFQQALRGFTKPVSYQPHGVAEASTVHAFIRGLRSDDLFAEYQQQDMVAVIDAAEFAALYPDAQPRKLDRVIAYAGDRTFVVQEWRGSPEGGEPVLYKLLLRGGSQ